MASILILRRSNYHHSIALDQTIPMTLHSTGVVPGNGSTVPEIQKKKIILTTGGKKKKKSYFHIIDRHSLNTHPQALKFTPPDSP
jgi:hypothetical protein